MFLQVLSSESWLQLESLLVQCCKVNDSCLFNIQALSAPKSKENLHSLRIFYICFKAETLEGSSTADFRLYVCLLQNDQNYIPIYLSKLHCPNEKMHANKILVQFRKT